MQHLSDPPLPDDTSASPSSPAGVLRRSQPPSRSCLRRRKKKSARVHRTLRFSFRQSPEHLNADAIRERRLSRPGESIRGSLDPSLDGHCARGTRTANRSHPPSKGALIRSPELATSPSSEVSSPLSS
ncbi:hypothetical protein CEXT_128641 [Caerostris extrusa]|uniref:Uncharacterized protein n=1 Tax=Caerostris extrusa TaxID=172846 RepID=A0AAV4V6U3_CAEEX|nr:hypothetical protein CEXT_128641 [Caerostris extrusa]